MLSPELSKSLHLAFYREFLIYIFKKKKIILMSVFSIEGKTLVADAHCIFYCEIRTACNLIK